MDMDALPVARDLAAPAPRSLVPEIVGGDVPPHRRCGPERDAAPALADFGHAAALCDDGSVGQAEEDAVAQPRACPELQEFGVRAPDHGPAASRSASSRGRTGKRMSDPRASVRVRDGGRVGRMQVRIEEGPAVLTLPSVLRLARGGNSRLRQPPGCRRGCRCHGDGAGIGRCDRTRSFIPRLSCPLLVVRRRLKGQPG